MHIAILTFDKFNEIDSLLPFAILNRIKGPDWRVSIAAPDSFVKSMNGLVIQASATIEEAVNADAVIIGSGMATRDVVQDEALMAQLKKLDPSRQLIGAQCSGALILAKLGLLKDIPACTDLITKPWVQEAGLEVLDQPFFAQGNIATAGGCLATQYLSFWILARLEGLDAAKEALFYVAPVGEKEAYLASAVKHVSPYLPQELAAA